MLAGAWGARAGDLLEQAGGPRVHRVGELAMLSPPDVVADPWCVWLWGAPEDHGALARFGGGPGSGEEPGALARALAELGEAAGTLLAGRFVLVALDRERGRCTVARDQLGAQPLVHARAADGVLFAEHECELLELLPRTPGPDRLALLQWVESNLTPRGRTLYEGVERLPAGHRLVLGAGRTHVERWWSPRYEGTEQGSAAELGERLREAAFAAVGRAAAGAQRPAVKLSGGLDSACVAAGLAAGGYAARRTPAEGYADGPTLAAAHAPADGYADGRALAVGAPSRPTRPPTRAR